MSKKKSKKPEFGNKTPNPFEKLDPKRSAKAPDFAASKKNRSKFIKKFRDSDLVYDHTSKKSRKLQLYNLEDPVTLTHKNRPIEENYESDVDQFSDEELELKGDYSNISELYKEYKAKRELSRRDKEDQKSLLSKLDSKFEQLDFSEFYKPAKKQVQLSPSEYRKAEDKPRPLGDYETNLKQLQLNINAPAPGADLCSEYKAAKDVAQRCDVVRRLVRSNLDLPNFCSDYVAGYLESLSECLASEDSGNFTEYLDCFCRGFLHLAGRSHREYKSHLEDELLKLDAEAGGVREYLLLLLVAKTVELSAELYKFALAAVERYLVALHGRLCAEPQPPEPEARLLVALAYTCVLESACYVPYFYHVCLKLCTAWGAESSLLLLKLVKATLNLLLKNGCNVGPVVALISASLESVRSHIARDPAAAADSLAEFEAFSAYIASLAAARHRPKALDIYNAPSLRVEYPKLKGGPRGPARERAKKRDREERLAKSQKAEYKALKRALLTESLQRADHASRQRAKQRQASERRYREVVRNAMIEQETLHKLRTTSSDRPHAPDRKRKRC